jgi:hypothetical protein
LAYQSPASSTLLSEQTSDQPAVLFSQNKSAQATSQTNRLHIIHPEVSHASLTLSFAAALLQQLEALRIRLLLGTDRGNPS